MQYFLLKNVTKESKSSVREIRKEGGGGGERHPNQVKILKNRSLL